MLSQIKTSQFYIVFIFLFLALSSCKDDDSITVEPDPDPNIETPDDTHLFVWGAMNSWYYFQSDVPDLRNDKDDDQNSFYNYLNGFDSPESLFESLIYRPDSVDPFSYLVDDYDELGSSLQAIYQGFGFDYGLIRFGNNNPSDVLGFVRYVLPGSPAETAGLKRGDLFLEADGTKLTEDNFRSLLIEQGDYELTMAVIRNNTIIRNGEKVQVSDNEFPRTPIIAKSIINLPGSKVGYLAYTDFASNFHSELNAVFGEFKAAGVNELVLDLRYNPGGSVLTAIYLNSMIHSTSRNKLMGSLEYNSKHTNNNRDIFFTDRMDILDEDFEEIGNETVNGLELSRAIIITSSGTASASEFVINGLRPYMDIKIIGDTTVGKNLGSISLYDNKASDYTNKENANTDHKYGLQPIVSKVFNSAHESDYNNGFIPDVLENEIDYIDNLLPLGDPEEQLLRAALDQICNGCNATTRFAPRPKVEMNQIEFAEPRQFLPNYQILDITGLQ